MHGTHSAVFGRSSIAIEYSTPSSSTIVMPRPMRSPASGLMRNAKKPAIVESTSGSSRPLKYGSDARLSTSSNVTSGYGSGQQP